MIRRLIILLLIVGCVFANNKEKSFFDGISIDLGLNASWMPSSFVQSIKDDSSIEEKGVIQYNFGIQKYLTNNFNIRIGYAERGKNYKERRKIIGWINTYSYTNHIVSLKYINLQLIKSLKLNDHVYLPIGFNMGYLLDNNYINPLTGNPWNLQYQKYDIGLQIGLEFKTIWKWSFGSNYYIGLINIYDEIESKNRSLQFYLKYKLS